MNPAILRRRLLDSGRSILASLLRNNDGFWWQAYRSPAWQTETGGDETSADQLTGLMLDLGRGAANYGDADFDAWFAGQTELLSDDVGDWATSGTSSLADEAGAFRFTHANNEHHSIQLTGLTVGTTYRTTVDSQGGTSTSYRTLVGIAAGNGSVFLGATTSKETDNDIFWVATATSHYVSIQCFGTGYQYFVHSTKEVPGYHASTGVTAERPYLETETVDSVDYWFVEHDPIDDQLAATLPDLGSAVTHVTAYEGEIRIDEGETIGAGSYDLPTGRWAAHWGIERALTTPELSAVVAKMAELVPGVTYGATLDRLDLLMTSAVAACIYDTTQDSDGGAWVNGATAQTSSWYTETLNTSTRGATQAFPALALLLVDTSNRVLLYDATDPALPMWMIFPVPGTPGSYFGAGVTSISAMEGMLSVGGNNGLVTIDYLADKIHLVQTGADYVHDDISTRGTTTIVGGGPRRIVNNVVNSVSMNVASDAPTDGTTGMKAPTIAAGTAGGVSVINNDGTVTDSDSTLGIATVDFDDNDGLYYSRNVATNIFLYSTKADYEAGDGFGDEVGRSTSGTNDIDLLVRGDDFVVAGGDVALVGNSPSANAVSGLMLLAPDTSDFTDSMSALITTDYNTGWMPQDVLFALSDTDDSDLVGGTVTDRSVAGNDFTVNGTVTRTAVADGAELVSYGGYSASNYPELSAAALDVGTGALYGGAWLNYNGTATYDNIFCYGDGVIDNTGWAFRVQTAGRVALYIGSNTAITSNAALITGWNHVAFSRSASGDVVLYINGASEGSGTNSNSVTCSASATLRFGEASNNSVITGGASDAQAGEICLPCVASKIKSAAQVLKTYNEELPLFQPRAKATIYGTDDEVDAVAYDSETGLVFVGTSDGRTGFDGLENVNERANAVSTVIAAHGGLIASR